MFGFLVKLIFWISLRLFLDDFLGFLFAYSSNHYTVTWPERPKGVKDEVK